MVSDAIATAGVFSHGKNVSIDDTIVAGGRGATLFSGGDGSAPLVTAGIVAIGGTLAFDDGVRQGVRVVLALPPP